MKRLVLGLSLSMVFCLTGGLLAAEPAPALPSQDLAVLEAAIFQAPQEEVKQEDAEVDWARIFTDLKLSGKRIDHCQGSTCMIQFCTCAEICEACGGVLARHCNPYSCTCNLPGCT